ncbi:3-isopropylmalate dehydratase small subunit [Sphaerisporangium sp. TRM90804]|uniref:3-isopropylmalate dehydratase small subunit n=1 Tax=Sphaerisporangium sp. TRM90804 TaxID=3031113 RepID=UPI00244D262A|nr:3-isopropylmalate dehydratase small subunit [Sphaerisporangium sp. TRM90804]MDH2427997.1 3-isopropylmalate dehydratase small subunit [Sphaerisporangium sp. TRM90804]
MTSFTVHTGTAVPLRRSDVDTDQIIPARFCTNPLRTGFAAALFADWRTDPGFPLDDPRYRGATVLVAGDNFGVGSSREAAVWALHNFGFRAILAPRFGDIFRANSLMNGLLTVTVPAPVAERLQLAAETDPATRITVDLRRLRVRAPGLTQPFTLDADVRDRLLAGLDPIAATLRHEADLTAYEWRRRPSLPTTI